MILKILNQVPLNNVITKIMEISSIFELQKLKAAFVAAFQEGTKSHLVPQKTLGILFLIFFSVKSICVFLIRPSKKE